MDEQIAHLRKACMQGGGTDDQRSVSDFHVWICEAASGEVVDLGLPAANEAKNLATVFPEISSWQVEHRGWKTVGMQYVEMINAALLAMERTSSEEDLLRFLQPPRTLQGHCIWYAAALYLLQPDTCYIDMGSLVFVGAAPPIHARMLHWGNGKDCADARYCGLLDEDEKDSLLEESLHTWLAAALAVENAFNKKNIETRVRMSARG